MIYNLSKPFEKQSSINRFKVLLEEGCTIELTKKQKKRTVKQNAYVHVLFQLVAINFGESTRWAKEYFYKAECNHELFMVEDKKGNHYLRSSADLDTKEMTLSIERMRNRSAELKHYLPTPEEYLEEQHYFQTIINSNKQFI